MVKQNQDQPRPKRADVTAEVARHLSNGTWRLSYHARDNMEIDGLNDADVLDVVIGGKRAERHDQYSRMHGTWNYAMHGTTADGAKLRVVVAFHAENMVVVNAFAL